MPFLHALTRLMPPARPGRTDIARRRLLGAAGLFAGAALTPAAAAATPALAGLPRAQLALMLRGLADLPLRADGGLDAQGAALLSQISAVMPEAPLLLRLHRIYPAPQGGSVLRPPATVDLDTLHAACHAGRPVSFDYRDLKGAETRRRVLPLELVHPAHGILLFAWCELRDAPRRFFVHSIRDLRIEPGDFTPRRADLLAAALEHAGA